MELKKPIFLIFIINTIFAFTVFANIANPTPANVDPEKEEVFKIVEQMPQFPGGEQELFKFIAKSVEYPKEAQEMGTEGKVIVSFIITKEGNVTDVQSIRDVNPLLEAEAIRVVKSMPKWTPGFQDGKAVSVSYILPIVFKLRK